MKFNPLAILTPQVLQGLAENGHRYFIRQQYPRGHNGSPQLKGVFVISHYDSYFSAKEHLEALDADRYRRLYDWHREADRRRLFLAASQPPGFRVYANLFSEHWQRQLTALLKDRLRRYVNGLGWNVSGSEALEPRFFPYFGQIHVCLQHGGREVRVNFDEIEKA